MVASQLIRADNNGSLGVMDQGGIALQLDPRAQRLARSSNDAEELLWRVSTALNSPLELKEVLRLLAEITRETSGADRCSIFLLEETRLYPAVSIARQPSPEHWQAFRTMKPVAVDANRARHFLEGGAIALEDARESELIPREWVDTFSLRGVAMMALRCAGKPCGLMTLDWAATHSFGAEELRTLETLASYAGMAVSNARPFEMVRRRARLQAALARGAAALAAPLTPSEIVERLADSYSELLGARVCVIALVDLDRDVLTSVAARNTRPVLTPMPLSEIPARIIDELGVAWAEAKRPVDLRDEPWLDEFLGAREVGASWYLLLPLLIDGETSGAALLGFDDDTRLDDEERAAAEALAAIAAAALERHELLGRLSHQLRRLDALYHVSATLAEGGNAGDFVAGLNRLLQSHGIKAVGVTFRDPKLARHLGGDRPTPQERAAWKANDGCVELADGSLAIPMRLGGRLVGTIRARPASLETAQRSFLEALATGIAEVASRGALRAELEEARRDQAIENERDRMAADLHDTAGQLFIAVGLLAGRLQEQLEHDPSLAAQACRLVELAGRGKHQIDEAILALSFLPAAQRGMAPSIRALARSVAADSGITIKVAVHGRAVRMPGRVEQALYRVAHEALMNAWRHSRGTAVHIHLRFGEDHVSLRVSDDGVGLAESPNGDGLHVGILGMRRVIAAAGGSVRVESASPCGVLVEACVPREEA
ncbi:MAG: two-component sensor histidine kinase [Acidimicrobiales bacterium]|nr:two-component sensor histidine kinase [Acidimicrobiales bacterium]